MKQTIITALAAALTLTLPLSSCLDKFPDDAIVDTKAIETLSDAQQAVDGIYASFKSSALYSGDMTLTPDIQCDMVHMVEGNSNTYGDFWRWEVKAADPNIEGVYAALYKIIGQCNFFFAYNGRLRDSIKDAEQLDALAELEGDVYFARALAYSELVKLFCKAYDPATASTDMGVVLVSDYYNPGPAKRATLAESYDFILADLGRADEMIVRDPATVVSYFTPVVVDALYARVYLYMQNWAEANKYATKVIEGDADDPDSNGPTHSLASVNVGVSTPTGEMSQYEAVWKYDQGAEIIWRVGFTATSTGGSLGRVFLNYNMVNYRPDFVVSDVVLSSFSSQDRRRQTFFAAGLPTGFSYTLTQPLLVKYEGNYSLLQVDARRYYHMSMPKPFRISEQYLIRAEARCRMAEAGISGMSYSQAAADIAALRAARYTGAGGVSLSADNWLDVISAERVKELFMEGFRLHDLKRWGRGFERAAQPASTIEGSKLKVEKNNPNFVWPIPQHEIDSPGSQIVQN
jgi:hypothetical protein